MDLYMQIGLVFAVMTAFASFIFIFNTPADMFVTGAVESQQEITQRVNDMDNLGLTHLLNNTSVSGSEVENIIRDASNRKIAVLLQTKSQGGFIVNYGYQLRSANTNSVKMGAVGVANLDTYDSITTDMDSYGTEFERNFVTAVMEVFQLGVAYNNSDPDELANLQLKAPHRGNTYIGSALPAAYTATEHDKFLNIIKSSNYSPNLRWFTPKVYISDRRAGNYSKAAELGRTFSSTGFFYTPDTIKTNMTVNNNFSYLEQKSSIYRLSKTANFYSTLILGEDGKIKGVYFEEHGVFHGGAVLGRAMLVNGTITQIY